LGRKLPSFFDFGMPFSLEKNLPHASFAGDSLFFQKPEPVVLKKIKSRINNLTNFISKNPTNC
jgi:hypothetical protein